MSGGHRTECAGKINDWSSSVTSQQSDVGIVLSEGWVQMDTDDVNSGR